MAVSKNNPAARDYMRLSVSCPDCGDEMQLLKRIPGGMFYVCQKEGKSIPVRTGSYKELPHQWVRK